MFPKLFNMTNKIYLPLFVFQSGQAWFVERLFSTFTVTDISLLMITVIK